jgi:S-formylglutathione hydrolase FrmB
LVGVAALLFAGLAAGTAAAANVTNDVAKSERLHELTVDTDAFSEPTKLHVFLPAGYDSDPAKRWPVTYALAGMQNNYDSFANVLRGEQLTAGYPSIVVSPDGNSGFWSDWFNAGAGGPPMYETFVIDQLIDLVDARYRTIADRAHRAIFGISMGGYGATSLAARHPDLFGSVATISGAVDSNNPLIGTTMSLASTFDGAAIDAINGPRATEEIRWHGTNPTDLASNLRGMDIQVRTANGILNPDIGEGAHPEDALSCIVENGVYQGSTSFNAKLDELGVDHLWKDYGNGCHTFENFTREVIDTLKVFTDNFADPPADPQKFEFKTIEPDFRIWGWQVKSDPKRALEFMTVEGSETSLSLTGSGMASVISPPNYKGLKAVAVNGKKVKPDSKGRVSFKVDLGRPHSIQQYRLGASTQFVTKQVSFKPYALIKIRSAKRKGKRVRVCARALGGVVPKAKLRAGKLKATMKIGPKVKCRTLKPARGRKAPGKPKQLVITGRDSYGHPVKRKAKIRG